MNRYKFLVETKVNNEVIVQAESEEMAMYSLLEGGDYISSGQEEVISRIPIKMYKIENIESEIDIPEYDLSEDGQELPSTE